MFVAVTAYGGNFKISCHRIEGFAVIKDLASAQSLLLKYWWKIEGSIYSLIMRFWGCSGWEQFWWKLHFDPEIYWQNKRNGKNGRQQILHHHSNRFLKIINTFRSWACAFSMSRWMETAFKKILEKIEKLLKEQRPRRNLEYEDC